MVKKLFAKVLFSLFSIIVAIGCSQNGSKSGITSPDITGEEYYILKVIVKNSTAVNNIIIDGRGDIRNTHSELLAGVKLKKGANVLLVLSGGAGINAANIVWSGGALPDTDDNKKARFIMDSDKTIVVTVSNEMFTLTLNESGNGKVEVKLKGALQSAPYTFANGTELTLEAKPDSGYKLDKYIIGSEEKTDKVITVKLDKNKTVNALFSKSIQYKLSYDTEYSSRFNRIEINGESFSAQSGSKYIEKGSTVKLEAFGTKLYKFSSYIIGTKLYYSNPLEITMDKDMLVDIYFSEVQQRTLKIYNDYNKLSYEVKINGFHDSYNNTGTIYLYEGDKISIDVQTPPRGYRLDYCEIITGRDTDRSSRNPINITVSGYNIEVHLYAEFVP